MTARSQPLGTNYGSSILILLEHWRLTKWVDRWLPVAPTECFRIGKNVYQSRSNGPDSRKHWKRLVLLGLQKNIYKNVWTPCFLRTYNISTSKLIIFGHSEAIILLINQRLACVKKEKKCEIAKDFFFFFNHRKCSLRTSSKGHQLIKLQWRVSNSVSNEQQWHLDFCTQYFYNIAFCTQV